MQSLAVSKSLRLAYTELSFVSLIGLTPWLIYVFSNVPVSVLGSRRWREGFWSEPRSRMASSTVGEKGLALVL